MHDRHHGTDIPRTTAPHPERHERMFPEVASSVSQRQRRTGRCDTAGVGIDWTHQLAEQLDRHWRGRLRPRYDGLTDAEYFWEPVANYLEHPPTGTRAGGDGGRR